MKTFSIIIISLIFFSAFVRAQSAVNPATAANPANPAAAPSPTSNLIADCIKNHGCNDSDEACRAMCAGVPNPSPQDVNATSDCIAKCPNTTSSEYQSCQQACINNNYIKPSAYAQSSVSYPTQTNTGLATPTFTGTSASASASASSTSSSSNKPSTPSPISAAPPLNQFQKNLYFALFFTILVATFL
ncbi:anchored cell wall protein 4 [Gigaspora margarita]|uniref:Anchored cell wall protein 4 n=1 Tax=Gigaspora margarita TaxID=4874 RepID=A0A8H4ANM8_GIGMA|nr:anchored cell wall protein 4 [Gigaspora margarita]